MTFLRSFQQLYLVEIYLTLEKLLNFICIGLWALFKTLPIPKQIFNVCNPVGLKLPARLRLNLSHLNQHKFNHNSQDCWSQLCFCSLEVESVSYFFLQCHYYSNIRFFNTLKWIKINWYKLVKSGEWCSSRNTSLW